MFRGVLNVVYLVSSLGQLIGSIGVIHWLCSIVVEIGRTGLRDKADVVLLG